METRELAIFVQVKEPSSPMLAKRWPGRRLRRSDEIGRHINTSAESGICSLIKSGLIKSYVG